MQTKITHRQNLVISINDEIYSDPDRGFVLYVESIIEREDNGLTATTHVVARAEVSWLG